MHAAGLARFACVLTGNLEVGPDIAQEAFVRVGSKLFGLRSDEHCRRYLYRTVINLSRGHGRKVTRELDAMRRMQQGTPERLPDVAAQDEVWTALQRVPPRQRAALYLRYYQDFSEVDAADALGCSLPAIKSLTYRGLKRMQQELEGMSND